MSKKTGTAFKKFLKMLHVTTEPDKALIRRRVDPD